MGARYHDRARLIECDWMSKTLFVTGAASGIGKATALLFGQNGWRVGCYDVDVEGARRVAEAIGSAGSAAHRRPWRNDGSM